MPTHAPPAVDGPLPPGWTYHVLNGRPFYYHAATNTTRQDSPSTGSFEMIPASYELYPANAPQLVSPQKHEQAQPQVEPEPPVPQHLVHTAIASFSAATEEAVHTLFPPPSSPQVHQAMMAPPLASQQMQQQMQQQHFAQALQPCPATYNPAVYNPPAQQTQVAPTVQAATQQPMMQLQVLVPEPGLRAGQQLAFTAPAAGPGTQPQQMTVTVNQEVIPGSIVTVQYPRPQAAQVCAVGPSSRLPTTQVNLEEDRRQSTILWSLYGSGLFCFCCIPPVGLLLWVFAISIYFCKPATQRAQYKISRTPAWCTAITCLICTVLGLVMIPVSIFAVDIDGNGVHPHHPHHGPWNGHHGHHGPHRKPAEWLMQFGHGHHEHHGPHHDHKDFQQEGHDHHDHYDHHEAPKPSLRGGEKPRTFAEGWAFLDEVKEELHKQVKKGENGEDEKGNHDWKHFKHDWKHLKQQLKKNFKDNFFA